MLDFRGEGMAIRGHVEIPVERIWDLFAYSIGAQIRGGKYLGPRIWDLIVRLLPQKHHRRPSIINIASAIKQQKNINAVQQKHATGAKAEQSNAMQSYAAEKKAMQKQSNPMH